MTADLFRSPAERERAREEREGRWGRITNLQPRPGHPGEYLAEVISPPDYLTPDQLDIFDGLWTRRVPGGTFTGDQLRGCVAHGFGWVCAL